MITERREIRIDLSHMVELLIKQPAIEPVSCGYDSMEADSGEEDPGLPPVDVWVQSRSAA